MRSVYVCIFVALLASCDGKPTSAAQLGAATAPAPIADLTSYLTQPIALVRNSGKDAPTRIDLVTFDPVSKQVKTRRPTTLGCERVALARQRILCLGIAETSEPPVGFRILNMKLESLVGRRVMQGAIASRARVAPDAAYAAATTFVTGHGYDDAGGMLSTEALIIDLKRLNDIVPPLESWTLQQNGGNLNAKRFNFWGVTFDPKNSDRFYLTAAQGKSVFLAKGSVMARRIELLQPNIECPSLSPDGTRIAFKKRSSGSGWLPAVLDLASGAVTVFKEAPSVDDQIEWMDNDTLLYERNTPLINGVQTDIMQLDVRHPDAPARLWLSNAGSPAVLRDRGL